MNNEIYYQSTNRLLNTGTITGFKKKITFKDALFMGQAPDKGLFMPTYIPQLSPKEILHLKGKPYYYVAYEILKRFLSSEIKDNELMTITKRAYSFHIPLEKLSQDIYIVRLDQGPTASFKDFAARIMARLMYKLKAKNENITILVATSGDTGSAIGEAFKGLHGIRVYILYPASEVSSIQKKQLNSIGINVQSLAIHGKFDDCQKIVKEAFSDPDLKTFNLTSANSINIGRILPQIVYYFYAYINAVDELQPVIFSIPSGNFGNSLGCELARRMGLPVERIIIATNENDEFPRYLKSGIYRKIEPSQKCLSNAMNVGNPSNLARYFDLYGGILDKDGIIHKQADIKEMKKRLYAVAISDEDTVKTIQRIYEKYNLILEPHGAVGVAALFMYFKHHSRRLAFCIETAHTAKFPEIIRQELGLSQEIPEAIQRISGKPDYLPNDFKKFKEYLIKRGIQGCG